jgi:hypothetical protein
VVPVGWKELELVLKCDLPRPAYNESRAAEIICFFCD